MIRSALPIAGALFLAASLAYAGAEQHYTPTRDSSCTERSRCQFEAWRCPGPGGYVAEYFDEGNVAGITIWNPARQRTAEVSLQWRGSGRVFGDVLEWQFRGDRPSAAAILRIWRVTVTADGHEREVEELMVLKLQPAGACRVASINARQADVNRRAQAIASYAPSMACLAAEDT